MLARVRSWDITGWLDLIQWLMTANSGLAISAQFLSLGVSLTFQNPHIEHKSIPRRLHHGLTQVSCKLPFKQPQQIHDHSPYLHHFKLFPTQLYAPVENSMKTRLSCTYPDASSVQRLGMNFKYNMTFSLDTGELSQSRHCYASMPHVIWDIYTTLRHRTMGERDGVSPCNAALPWPFAEGYMCCTSWESLSQHL